MDKLDIVIVITFCAATDIKIHPEEMLHVQERQR